MRTVLFLWLALLMNCHAGPEECKKACWKFAEMSHWERFAAESAPLEPEQVSNLRRAFEQEWQELRARDHDPGRDNCLMECRRSVTPQEAQCMLAAKSTAAFSRCQE